MPEEVIRTINPFLEEERKSITGRSAGRNGIETIGQETRKDKGLQQRFLESLLKIKK